jgi:hypothetical protein
MKEKIFGNNFFQEGFPALIERLVLMARGIGDPLVAAYARVYLTFVVHQGVKYIFVDL